MTAGCFLYSPKNTMQMAYRVTKWNTPDADETLIGSREQAFEVLADLDAKLSRNPKPPQKATYLCAKATLYEALGDTKMLEAAKEAYTFCKNANSAALVAVAYHHFGQLKEANIWYERAWKYPHEAGFEIDIGYSNSLMCRGEWLRAWPIVRNLKKRMVYAGYMKEWDGRPCNELQIISEGGFGDIIQNSRFLPLLKDKGVKQPIVYLPPFFYEHGLVDLARQQFWFPEIRNMLTARQNVPSVGFFDLPAVFQTTPQTLPPATEWTCIKSYNAPNLLKPVQVGFCWAAKAFETPLCPRGIYRSLTDEQANRIINTPYKTAIDWVSLQKDVTLNNSKLHQPVLEQWKDTADLISKLDIIITVDTAVMHLAASMSKPVIVILSGASDWKFGIDDERCLWYPNIEIIRNTGFGFDDAVDKLITVISGNGLLDRLTVKKLDA